ncbi:MAG: HlyD family type I secretion periplasmic adaptor subunit [Pseudomonadota bacterium]
MTQRPKYSARFPMAVGLVALGALVGVIGVWSVRTEIAGAIIASGTIVVENNRQIVQHAEGGVVGAISARDGDVVEAGDLLVKLDDKLLRSELAVAELQLVELRARRARLQAERDDANEIVFDDTSDSAAEQQEGQRKLFEARRRTLQEELNQIDERIRQTGNQIKGVEAQLDALKVQETLILDELEDLEDLLDRGLVQATRVTTLRRDAAQISGEIGKLNADIAQFADQIAAFEIEKLKLENTRREGAIVELRDVQFQELELVERRSSLVERLSRLEIRAPATGVVYGSTVFAQSAVIQPAEPLMYVIPRDQPLLVNAQVDAIHIDQVHMGQPVTLRFSAFNQRLTPELTGEVVKVSADVLRDEVTGLNYYLVEIELLPEEVPKLDAQELVPGMPVEAYLRTDDRTPLSYLTKPLTDYFDRSFRES